MKTGGHHGQKFLSGRFSVTPAEKSGRNFCQMKKVGLFMSFQLTPPLNFFGGQPWKKILFFLFKVSTYVFGIGIIFLLTLLQILIWGKKVLTLGQKMHFFFDKTARFPLKKAFSIEISKNNAHTLPFYFTWSVKTTHKLFRSFLIHKKRYSELLSVFDFLFQFEMKPPNSRLFSWDVQKLF